MNVITENRIEEAVAACEECIGGVWGEMFPEAKTGDFPPDAAFDLDRALDSAVRTWLAYNTDLLDD